MKIKAQPIIKRFIANYLIVLIIPMLVIMFIYFNTINSFKQETYKTHLSIIEKISDDVGEYFHKSKPSRASAGYRR